MSIVEHLQELRSRVIKSLVALAAATAIGFVWYQHSIPGVPALADFLLKPYCDLPPEQRASITATGECRLLGTGPFDQFMLRLKVGAIVGMVLASPIWLYQLWAFITPGLLRKERKYTFAFIASSVSLFVLGAALAYLILPIGLQLLLGIGDEAQVTALNGREYFNFVLAMLILFGVSFEVPLIMVMLNIVDVLHYEHLKDKRRHIIVGLFIFAAIMTPGQDPVGMTALALAMCLLVEGAMQFCRINDKRRDRSRPEWLDLDDHEQSRLDPTPSPIASPAPVTDVDGDPTAGRSSVSWADDGRYGDVL